MLDYHTPEPTVVTSTSSGTGVSSEVSGINQSSSNADDLPNSASGPIAPTVVLTQDPQARSVKIITDVFEGEIRYTWRNN